jgi:hypothetical protein
MYDGLLANHISLFASCTASVTKIGVLSVVDHSRRVRRGQDARISHMPMMNLGMGGVSSHFPPSTKEVSRWAMGTRRCGSVRIGYNYECKDRPGKYPLSVEAAFPIVPPEESSRRLKRRRSQIMGLLVIVYGWGERGHVNRNDDGYE